MKEEKTTAVNTLHLEEVQVELETLKSNWQLQGRYSGSLELPENMLDLEGVEYLLKLNIFNEVPSVLRIVAPVLIDFKLLSEASTYSETTFKEYVEKGSELIERLLGLYKELGIDLANASDYQYKYNTDLYLASKWYIEALASDIGKAEEYSLT